MKNKITAEIMEDIELFYDEMLSVRDILYNNGTEIRSEEDNEYIMDILYNNAKEVLYNRIRQKLDLMNKQNPGVVIKSSPEGENSGDIIKAESAEMLKCGLK